MLASIPRSTGRSHAATLALALSLSLPGTALAAPKASVPPPPAEPAKAAEPAAAGSGLEVVLPIEGNLAKDSRRTLAERLQAAAAAAKVSGGPYRVKLSVRAAKKRDYALALTVLGPGDATVAAPTDECKGCSLDQVGAKIDALVQQATASLAAPPEPTLASISLATDPAGARVRIDGTERGVTPQVLELPAGEHRIAIDKPGFLAHEQTITVEPGAEQSIDVKLTAQPAAAPSKKQRKHPGRGLKIGGGVMFGLGLAGVAAGVAMILIDEDPKPCSGTDVDFRGVCRYRYDTLLGGIVGTAAGALGVAGGMAMMIQGHRIAVRARASKQQAFLGISVRF